MVKARRKAIERIYLKERRKINLVHWLGDALGSLLSCSVATLLKQYYLLYFPIFFAFNSLYIEIQNSFIVF